MCTLQILPDSGRAVDALTCLLDARQIRIILLKKQQFSFACRQCQKAVFESSTLNIWVIDRVKAIKYLIEKLLRINKSYFRFIW